MKALTPTEQINLLRKERSAQTAKIRKLEADIAYIAMMTGVDLTQKETEEDAKDEEKE